MIRKIWNWLKSHFIPMPDEPDFSKEKQADNPGAAFGFRWWF